MREVRIDHLKGLEGLNPMMCEANHIRARMMSIDNLLNDLNQFAVFAPEDMRLRVNITVFNALTVLEKQALLGNATCSDLSSALLNRDFNLPQTRGEYREAIRELIHAIKHTRRLYGSFFY